MTNMDFLRDRFLEKMITNESLDQPSKDFTAGVMNRISSEFVLKEANQPILSLKYWLLIALGFIVAGFVLFGLDWSFMDNLFGNISVDKIILPQLSLDIVGSFKTLLAYIHVSPVIIISLAALGSLLLLDKILKKPFTTHFLLLL